MHFLCSTAKEGRKQEQVGGKINIEISVRGFNTTR